MTESEFWGEYNDEDIKAEWVRGRVFVAPPATGLHSDINGWLLRLVAEFVEFHDLGLVRGPQFPVRLGHIQTIRIPDIIFVSKARSPKICPGYLDGAPDLVVEIVSRDSLPRDWRDKYGDYQTAGVREYWVVNPLSNCVEIYTLDHAKKYVQIQPDKEGRIRSKVLRGLYLQPSWLWRSPLPKLAPC